MDLKGENSISKRDINVKVKTKNIKIGVRYKNG